MPEKRRSLPALNASSDRKEKGIARNMARKAAASKKIPAATPKTHRQTAPQLKGPPQSPTQHPQHSQPRPTNTKAHHNLPVTTAVNHPASTPCHHSYTPNHQHPQSPPRPPQTHPRAQKKKSRLNVTSIGTSEKRQLPTLPPGGAVPSALVSLTSLFGMGRGGSSPL